LTIQSGDCVRPVARRGRGLNGTQRQDTNIYTRIAATCEVFMVFESEKSSTISLKGTHPIQSALNNLWTSFCPLVRTDPKCNPLIFSPADHRGSVVVKPSTPRRLPPCCWHMHSAKWPALFRSRYEGKSSKEFASGGGQSKAM
jgi:hypothetical protein